MYIWRNCCGRIQVKYNLFGVIYFIFSQGDIKGIKSLWPSDAICHHESLSTSFQVMACCRMALRHSLNQWWCLVNWTLLNQATVNLFIKRSTYWFKKMHLKWCLQNGSHITKVSKYFLYLALWWRYVSENSVIIHWNLNVDSHLDKILITTSPVCNNNSIKIIIFACECLHIITHVPLFRGGADDVYESPLSDSRLVMNIHNPFMHCATS